MQRRGGCVKADIGDELAGLRLVIHAREVGALVDIAALFQNGEKIGLRLKIGRHGILGSSARRFNRQGASAQRDRRPIGA